MSDSEDATAARLNELFEESQDHANVPAPDNANIPAPGNVPGPSSSENASSPRVLSEEEYANWFYKGPSGRGWAREKTPWHPRREKPSAKNAAGGTAAGRGDTGNNGASPSHGPSGQAAPAPANGDAQDQQQEPDDGTDEDADHEFDDLFEEEETSAAADASTGAGTPVNDFQTPGTEYSDADSNFK